MIRRSPRSTRTDTLFPYTTLFRSDQAADFRGYASGGGDAGLVPRDVQIGFVQRQRLDDVGEAREYLPHLGGHGAIDLEPGADEQQVGAEPPRPGARHGGADAILDRKSVVWGKSVSVSVDLGGRSISKK